MENIAEAAGICTPRAVEHAMESELRPAYKYLTKNQVNNIDKLLQTYQVPSYPDAALMTGAVQLYSEDAQHD
jgi:hypothetical protein